MESDAWKFSFFALPNTDYWRFGMTANGPGANRKRTALFEGRSLQSMKRRTLDTAGDRSYGKVFPAFTSCDTNGTCFFVGYPRIRLG